MYQGAMYLKSNKYWEYEVNTMKKRILYRSLWGMPIGIAISYLITVAISATVGDGVYYPVVPALETAMGSEINAVLIQLLCSAFYGAVFTGASVIWEIETWSVLRMTITHLLVISILSFPIAWVMLWIPHDFWGAVIYFAIFFGIYAIIWFFQYSAMKKIFSE